MKRTTAILSILLVLLTCCISAQADGKWVCPQCGQLRETDYCPTDGTPRPPFGYASYDSIPSSISCGEYVTFGSYRGEDISWKVLSVQDGTALLMTEHAILCREMNHDNYTYWENSDLRYWLNGDFFDSAFWGVDQYMHMFDSEDYVTIPTYDDMTNPAYGFSSNPEERTSRMCTPTSSVRREGRIYLSESGSGACGYYTRTVRKVKDDGTLIFWYVKANNTMNDTTANRTDRGVRIMIRVDAYAIGTY